MPSSPAAPAAMPLIPFFAASNEHTELFDDRTITTSAANPIQVGPIDIPAYGFLRHVWLRVDISGGTLGAGVLGYLYPFNWLDQVTLMDVNGAPIVGPLSGEQLAIANIVGGYAYRQDPRDDPNYVGTINGTFFVRVPVEISHHNALGALANQNAASTYKLRYAIKVNAGASSPFSTNPTTSPTTVRVRALLEAWTQPAPTDPMGRPQATVPPRHGTTQFWTAQTRPISSGQNTINVQRVGNLIRNLVIICRNSSGVPVATQIPDPIRISLDARDLFSEPGGYRTSHQFELIESQQAGSAFPAGVLVYNFDNSVLGKAGDGSPAAYLPTVQSTRLDIIGNFAAAGSVDILVNDVAPVETDPATRYADTATGFRPGALTEPIADQ